MLVEAVKQKGVEGNSLLDVGGGIGAIQHELFKAGIARADTHERTPTSGHPRADTVEASTAYIDANKEEAER